MSLGKRKKPKQRPLWIAHNVLASNSGHPFYTRLNRLLDDDRFDTWLEGECSPYFTEGDLPRFLLAFISGCFSSLSGNVEKPPEV